MKHFVFYIFIITAALITGGCSDQAASNKSSALPVDSIIKPNSEVFGATIYLYDKEMITAKVNAVKILKFDLNDSTMAYELDIDILDSLGKVTTNIVGDSGIIREKDAYLQIYGNVKVITEDSTTLDTDFLRWDSKTDRISTHSFVRIVQDNDVITGWGLDADHKLNSIKILDRVSGEIKDPDKFKDE